VNAWPADVFVVSISPDVGWLALPILDVQIATVSIAHNDVPTFYTPAAHYAPFLDCAVGVSEETQRKLVTSAGIPPERTRRIPYGVQALSPEKLSTRLASQTNAHRPLAIGYIGRVVQDQKRVMDFVPLVRELKRSGVAFQLHLFGDGEDKGELEKAFRLSGLREHVCFHGWLSADALKDRLLELDIFLLMSEFEGLCVALLEAMANGVVPVASRIASGNGEVIADGNNGFLVAPRDIQGFADRIKVLAGDPGRLRSMQKSAWEIGSRYSIERMVDSYVDCFRDIRSPGGLRAPRPNSPSRFPVMASCHSRYPYLVRKAKQLVLSLIQRQ